MVRAMVRVVLVSALATVLLGFGAGAFADDLQNCIDQGTVNGVPPDCVEVNGKYVPVSGSDGGSGIPSGFVVFGVLVVAAGIGITLWKVGTARRLASDAGLDPALATQVALLTPDGLDATYLAAALKPKEPASGTTPPHEPASAGKPEERLTTLKGLLDHGLVTQQEYDERRRAILDDV